MADRKVILTVAPTGGMADKSVTPHLPTQLGLRAPATAAAAGR